MGYTRKSALVFATALVSILLAAPYALAHDCGYWEITIPLNWTGQYRITADVDEVAPSIYQITYPEDQAIASVVSSLPFTDYDYGEWLITPHAVGNTYVEFRWDYSPNGAAGFCGLTIYVVPEEFAPRTTPDESHTGSTDEPINMLSGAYWHETQPDLVLPNGNMPIEFTRFYYSRRHAVGTPQGSLGVNWTHNWEAALLASDDTYVVDMPGGRRIEFVEDGSGFSLQPPVEVPYQMRRVLGEIVVLDPTSDRRYFFEEETVGRFLRVMDRNDNSITINYDHDGQGRVPVEIVGHTGQQLSLSYAGWQLVSSVTDGTRTVQFLYAGAGPDDWLWRVIDPLNKTTSYEYADPFTYGPGLLTAAVQPLGNRRYIQSYNTDGTVDTQTDSDAHTWTMQYQAGSNRFAAPTGDWMEQTHDGTGQLTDITRMGGHTRQYEYDTEGRRTRLTWPDGSSEQMAYDTISGKVQSLTDRQGSTSIFTYTTSTDGDGFQYRDLQQITHPDGGVETYAYDTRGNLTARSDTRNNVTSYTYDDAGNLLTETNTDLGQITYTYDTQGNLEQRSESTGSTISYDYDLHNRLTTVTNADATTRQYTYDARDRVVELVNENLETVVNLFDDNGNLVFRQDPMLGLTQYQYDAGDRLIGVVDRSGRSFARSYDSRGNLASDGDQELNTTTYDYDAAGNLSEITDAVNDRTSLSYDIENRLIAINVGQLYETRYEYDLSDRVTRRERPSGTADSFEYDVSGRLIGHTDPVQRRTEWSYDMEGNVLGVGTPGNGASINATYNALNKPETVTNANGETTSYEYDPLGRLTARIDPGGARTEYHWNDRPDIDQVTYPDLSTVTIVYDDAGQITERQYPGGLILSQTYDARGLLTSVEGRSFEYDAEGNVILVDGLTLDRNHPGNLVSGLTYEPGKTAQYAYDAAGRHSGTTDWTAGAGVTYSTDASGRRSGVQRPNGCDATYSYDIDGALAGIDETCNLTPVIQISLTRNAAGDVTGIVRDTPLQMPPAPETAIYAYDENDRIVGHTYDGYGRWTGDGSMSCDWDEAGRLSGCTNGQVTTYGHNGFGQVTSFSNGTETWGCGWNAGLGSPGVATVTHNGTPRYFNVHDADGQLSYRIDATTDEREFYLFDEQGNTSALTDEAGAVICSYSYTPGGCVVQSGSCDNLFTYRARENTVADPFFGELFHQGARVYHCEQTRYLDPNPLGPSLMHPNHHNEYAANGGNPLGATNPFGLSPDGETWLGKGLGVASAVGSVVSEFGAGPAKELDQAFVILRAVANNPGLGDPRLGGSGLNQALGRVIDASKVNNVVNGSGAKLLGRVGSAASLLGIGLELYKLNADLEQLSENYDRTVQRGFATASLATRRAWMSFCAGRTSYPTLRLRLITAQNNLKLVLLNADQENLIDTVISSYAAFGNVLGSAIPLYGVVTPTFQNAGDIQRAREEQAHKNRR